jgi:hypothetical protein
VASGVSLRRKVSPGCPFCPPVFLPDRSRRLLTRTGFADVLGSVGGLDLAQDPLEGVEVFRSNLDRDVADRRCGRSTEATERRCGLRATLPPAPRDHGNQGDNADLQEKAKERGHATKPAHHAMAEQHPEEAGTGSAVHLLGHKAVLEAHCRSAAASCSQSRTKFCSTT